MPKYSFLVKILNVQEQDSGFEVKGVKRKGKKDYQRFVKPYCDICPIEYKLQSKSYESFMDHR